VPAWPDPHLADPYWTLHAPAQLGYQARLAQALPPAATSCIAWRVRTTAARRCVMHLDGSASADHRRRQRHRRAIALSCRRGARVLAGARRATRGGRRRVCRVPRHRRRRHQRGDTAHGGAARAAHGPIDILIANAGVAASAPAAKIDLAHWQRMIDVNLTGAFLSVKAALPDITRGGAQASRIVFIASTAGLKGYAYVAAYCAAKHGLVGLARALAVELAPRGVTVNAVCPGFTQTPLLEASLANIAAKTGRSRAEAEVDLKRLNPQGRFILPQEVADTVLWLCTPAAQSINGQAISVSGGEA
jgi:NAD(P)-dependent dehydrogenase (short-subunit alcohol dehydrogenase family)